MPKTKAIINTQNVVAAATLNQKVDLNAVVKSFPGVQYRPEQEQNARRKPINSARRDRAKAIKREELVVERSRRENDSPILSFHLQNMTGR
jgi:hypothetical protein